MKLTTSDGQDYVGVGTSYATLGITEAKNLRGRYAYWIGGAGYAGTVTEMLYKHDKRSGMYPLTIKVEGTAMVGEPEYLTIEKDETIAARALGRKGGSVKSEAKTKANQAKGEYGAQGGRPTYSQAAAREIERENKRFASLPAAASGSGMDHYAEEHVRIIDSIIAKYGCRKEVTKVLANGIKCVTVYDKDDAIVAEHHE